MIVARIVGGLGNQIYCYAFGRVWADTLGVALKLDITAYRDYKLHQYSLDRFTIDAQVATDAEIAAAKKIGTVAERTLLFDPLIADVMRDGVYLDGYWGDYRYSLGGIFALRKNLRPRDPFDAENAHLLQQMQGTESVSLHIRRGDYVTNAHGFVLPMTYYEDAIREMVYRVPAAQVYVFSDDPDWVEKNLTISCPHTLVRNNDANRNVEDLQLMRSCSHHIIANSTFSFWAAWLDPKADGHVIAPQQYFKPGNPYLIQTFGEVVQPVWPPAWKILPLRATKILPKNNPYLNIAGGDCRNHPIRIGVWHDREGFSTDGFQGQNADTHTGDSPCKPWVDLFAYGQAHGIHFVTLDHVQGPEGLDAVIFQERPQADHPMVGKMLESKLAKYLCLWEPEVIQPDNWEPEFHKRFERIFTWSDELVDHRRYIKLNCARDPESPYDFEILKTAFQQRKLCTLIADAQQVSHPNELFSERLEAIRWFETHAPDAFDLYGVGWTTQEFSSYQGSVQDELATLSHYRFALCYECARNYPGYITGKILDCFRAGVVPVYLGAPNIEQWIPRDCYLDRNDFRDYQQLQEHLSAMPAQTHGSYLDRIQTFLGSSKAYPFSTEAFITTLTGYITRDVQARRGDIPDVTVAIPAYNYGRFLETALECALSQSIDKLEVLILDNASTDSTPEVASRYAGDPRLRYMRNTRNIGGYHNWQNILNIASGRYVAILSADDYYLPGHLSRMVKVMDENPRVAIAYCPCVWVDEENNPLYVLNHPGHSGHDYIGGRNEVASLLCYDCYITPSAALVRRTALDVAGPLNQLLQGAVDWDLWIRIAEQGSDFAFFNDPKVCYRVHSGQSTANQVASAAILIDHVQVLWNALERGSLRLFHEQADEVIAVLWEKYTRYPEEQVAYLLPHLRTLERLIKGREEVDYRKVRQDVNECTEQNKAAKSKTDSFISKEGFWSERRLLLVKKICHLRKQSRRRNDLRAGVEAEQLQRSLGHQYFPLFVYYKLARPWQNLKQALAKSGS